MASYGSKARVARFIALGCFFGLQLVYLLKTVLLPVAGKEPNFIMWAIHAMPLMLFLPGMLRSSYRSFAWLCFVVLIYFTADVDTLMVGPPSIYAWPSLILVVVLFIASVCFIRWQARQFNEDAAKGAQATHDK